jgi:phage host-nuclease inhibitor protein Gam
MKSKTTQLTTDIILVGATPEETVTAQLEQLTQMRAEHERLLAEKEEAITALIPADVRKKIAGQKRAFNTKLNRLDKDIAATVKTVKTFTLQHGETIKANGHMAVFKSGHVSWNSSKVEGYLLANKQNLDNFRKVGNPSVSIRKS